VTAALVLSQMRLIPSPNRIAPVKYDGRGIDPETMDGVVMYVCGYIVTIGVLSVAMTLVGVDAMSALMGIWTSIGNIGYGYGPMVARTGTFVDFPDSAKWLMIVTMLMGRLALLAFFVVLLPRFWVR
jgi:trk system potassium uptake protein TrkH